MSSCHQIRNHYELCWGAEATVHTSTVGRYQELPSDFCILIFPPRSTRSLWTYATCGMSQQPDAPRIELHLLSPQETDAHIELLAAIAHYHLTGEYVGLGHTVNFGRPWLPDSMCDHGLISLPYLDGPKLEWMNGVSSRKVRFLWLIPITAKEVAFMKKEGLEALESRLEHANFDYADPLRSSVV